MRLFKGFAVGVVALACSGCLNAANYTSIYRSPDLDNGRSLVLDAEQYVLINRNGDTCVMPSPDAMASAAASGGILSELTGGGGNGSASASAGAGESAASIGLRTQSIQLLRDSLFALCLQAQNEMLDPFNSSVLMRRYQSQLVAVLAIEQLTGTVAAGGGVTGAEASARTSGASGDGLDGPFTEAGGTSGSSGSQPVFANGPTDPQSIAAIAQAVQAIVASVVQTDHSGTLCFEYFRLGRTGTSADLDQFCQIMMERAARPTFERLTDAYVRAIERGEMGLASEILYAITALEGTDSGPYRSGPVRLGREAPIVRTPAPRN